MLTRNHFSSIQFNPNISRCKCVARSQLVCDWRSTTTTTTMNAVARADIVAVIHLFIQGCVLIRIYSKCFVSSDFPRRILYPLIAQCSSDWHTHTLVASLRQSALDVIKSNTMNNLMRAWILIEKIPIVCVCTWICCTCIWPSFATRWRRRRRQ